MMQFEKLRVAFTTNFILVKTMNKYKFISFQNRKIQFIVKAKSYAKALEKLDKYLSKNYDAIEKSKIYPVMVEEI